MAGLERQFIAAISVVVLATPMLCAAQTSAPDVTPPPATTSPARPASPAPPPAGRISFLDGSLSVLPPGAQQWNKAFLDRPVSAGEQLWSDKGSRAEVDIGGMTVRLSANSELSLLDLSDQTRQIGIGVGTIDVALHYADANQSFEIDSPQVAMTIQRGGDYRVNVDLDGTTTVLVHKGAVHLSGRSGEGISLRDGQGVVFAADGTLDVADAHTADSFDRWCSQRDAVWQQAQSTARSSDPSGNVADNASSDVVNDVPGADPLSTAGPDNAGEWSNQPGYGDVWYPAQVPAGWTPYRSGRLAWAPRLGWIWIDRVHSRGSAPPTSILHRPVITSHELLGAAGALVPHVVASAPAPRRTNEYVPIPAPVGPTIYARDVRPDTSPRTAPDMPGALARETASHAALLNASSRSPVIASPPPRAAASPLREASMPRAPAVPPPVPSSVPHAPRATPSSPERSARPNAARPAARSAG